MDLTVSIVNHNSTEPLRECLESVIDNVGNKSCEIYVVDNLCEDRAAGMLAEDFPSVKILRNSEVLGFSANHNQVLQRACGKYILVLNPDTMLSPGTIKHMMTFMDKYPSAALCGPKIVDQGGNWEPPPKRVIDPLRDILLWSLYISNAKPSFIHHLQSLRHRFVHILRPHKQRSNRADDAKKTDDEPLSQPCEVINGACMFFRASAIREIGGFDERFFLYKEEVDWCLRAGNQGWETHWLPNASVLHIGGYSTRSQYLAYLGVFVQSALAFYEKHRGALTKSVLRVVLTLVAITNLLRWSLISRLCTTRRAELHPWIDFTQKLMREIWTNQQKDGERTIRVLKMRD